MADHPLLGRAAEGDAEAQVHLGLAYRDGDGVPRDEAEAVRWFRLSADQGHPRGQDNLGFMLLRGWGIDQDEEAAVGWFRKSAEQGNHWGLNNLANCYDHGEGVERDEAAAARLRKAAVEAGSRYACLQLAARTMPGVSEREDWAESREWLERGHALGDDRCASTLAYLLWEGIGGEEDRGKAKELWGEHDPEMLRYVSEMEPRANEAGRFANLPVAHLHQWRNLCGPTAVAMAAASWGEALHPHEIKRRCPDSPLGTGTDWGKIVTVLREAGLDVRLDTWPNTDAGFEEGMAALRSDFDRGRVVVIDVIWPENESSLNGHTMLASGYDEDSRTLIVHDPAMPHPGIRLFPYDEWKAIWHSRWFTASSTGMARPVIRLVGD